jgi:hypothetical protein
MADRKRKRDKKKDEGKVLPQREMMSLVSADPADPMYSSMIPPGAGPFAPGLGGGDTLPIEGPNVDGAEDSESSSTTVQDSDSASADS